MKDKVGIKDQIQRRNPMNHYKYIGIFLLYWFSKLLMTGMVTELSADVVDFTITMNGSSKVTPVEGQEMVDKIEPLITRLTMSLIDDLNTIEGWGPLTNNENSSAQIGAPLNLNLRIDTDGYTHFTYTFNNINADIHFTYQPPPGPDADVFYSATAVVISGFIDPDSQAIHDLELETHGDMFEVFIGGVPTILPPKIQDSIFNNVENSILGYLNETGEGQLSLFSLLNLFLGNLVQINGNEQILKVLELSSISTRDITIMIEINPFTGKTTFELMYEEPYSGNLIRRDTAPIRGLMFSSWDIRVTKQSLGFTGGDLSQYDDIYTDELQFFKYLENMNIKFIRSDITWQSIEPLLDPISSKCGCEDISRVHKCNDYIDDYIDAHAQVLDNLEVHFQYANQYLLDFLVTIGEGRSAPLDPQTGKNLWVGYKNWLTQEDYDLGYTSNDFQFISRETYLTVVERHVRALVRRLKNVIHFWQIENELNQADINALSNLAETSKRYGSAWAHLDFLDDVFKTMSNSITLEDCSALITHNFHPFRISKIQDWGQYLDIIGLTYHPNFLNAFPLMGFSTGEMVKVAYNFLSGPTKPVWILSASYPAMVDGGSAGWDFNKTFGENLTDFNTERQIQWVSDAMTSSGNAEVEGFFYRTYQALDPDNPISFLPNGYAGLIYPDGTPKASHDGIISMLAVQNLFLTLTGPDTLAPGQSGTFTANASGGVIQTVNGVSNYENYRWEKKRQNSNWHEIASGPQYFSISHSGCENFWLRCEVTDYYGFTKMSYELPVIVDATISNISEEKNSLIPKETKLLGNYPNPFNPITKINYGLNEAGRVRLIIYNTLGQVVRVLVNEEQSAGYKNIEWNGKNDLDQTVPSNIYIYRLITEKYEDSGKMLLIR
jgi:hypothetical protein